MKQESEKKFIGISLKISAEANKLLSSASKRCGRTKRAEATMRLEDHIFRYPSIAEISKEKKINKLKDKELINEQK